MTKDYWSFWTPWTWIAHGAISLVVASAAAIGAFLLWHNVLAVVLGFDVGASAMAVYFNLRETKNRRDHLLSGQYDLSQFGAGATSREDRVGDLVGPYAVAITSMVLSILMAGAWLLARQGG